MLSARLFPRLGGSGLAPLLSTVRAHATESQLTRTFRQRTDLPAAAAHRGEFPAATPRFSYTERGHRYLVDGPPCRTGGHRRPGQGTRCPSRPLDMGPVRESDRAGFVTPVRNSAGSHCASPRRPRNGRRGGARPAYTAARRLSAASSSHTRVRSAARSTLSPARVSRSPRSVHRCRVPYRAE